MPLIPSIAARATEMRDWRRALHRMPELGFDLPRTARFVAERLQDFGVDALHEGIATSGIVAVIEGRAPGPTIGLRADMDALPILESTGAPHASEVPGRMHACGHDGHTAMLLGAARHLAETRAFAGSVALIFQPAEEFGGGGEVMVRDGVLDRFEIAEVYALHNAPGLEEGTIHTAPGAIMAAVDTFHVDVAGQGGHAALPHLTRDPIAAALGIGAAIQTVVSRNAAAEDALVVSITQIHAGSSDNIVPSDAYICGTVRTFDAAVQDRTERRLREIVAGQAASYGVEARLRYERGYPATVNHPAQAERAARIAAGIVGAEAVQPNTARAMWAEDFAYMLQARPGAYLFVGAGDGPGLHSPGYDFNDRIAPVGASLLARLAEETLPLP